MYVGDGPRRETRVSGVVATILTYPLPRLVVRQYLPRSAVRQIIRLTDIDRAGPQAPGISHASKRLAAAQQPRRQAGD